jgi:hypothetical protein
VGQNSSRVLPFILKCRKPNAFGVEIPRKTGPKKNSENFRILQSHNLLSARCLQKTVEASIYKNAENSENFDISQSHNMLSERHLLKPLNLLLT